jgi:tripartite-type tricarboxylate transporter receptor subunit TctC
MKSFAIRFVLASAAALLAASAASAQTSSNAGAYPARPVRIIVPFAAGGPSDIFARLIGQKLSDRLGKQFYVENQAGAGGNIGMGAAARAAPDGYTIAVVSSSFLVTTRSPTIRKRISSPSPSRPMRRTFSR